MLFFVVISMILSQSSGQAIFRCDIPNLKEGTRSTENLTSELSIPTTFRMIGAPSDRLTLKKDQRNILSYRDRFHLKISFSMRILLLILVRALSTAVLRTLNIFLGEIMVQSWRSRVKRLLQAGEVLWSLLRMVAKFGFLHVTYKLNKSNKIPYIKLNYTCSRPRGYKYDNWTWDQRTQHSGQIRTQQT